MVPARLYMSGTNYRATSHLQRYDEFFCSRPKTLLSNRSSHAFLRSGFAIIGPCISRLLLTYLRICLFTDQTGSFTGGWYARFSVCQR